MKFGLKDHKNVLGFKKNPNLGGKYYANNSANRSKKLPHWKKGNV